MNTAIRKIETLEVLNCCNNRILKLFQAKPVQESQQMPRGVDPFMWKSYGGRS